MKTESCDAEDDDLGEIKPVTGESFPTLVALLALLCLVSFLWWMLVIFGTFWLAYLIVAPVFVIGVILIYQATTYHEELRRSARHFADVCRGEEEDDA